MNSPLCEDYGLLEYKENSSFYYDGWDSRFARNVGTSLQNCTASHHSGNLHIHRRENLNLTNLLGTSVQALVTNLFCVYADMNTTKERSRQQFLNLVLS
jgi:hypothetical protein